MLSTLPFMPADNEHLDISSLETWLWDAACVIRGAIDESKAKDFILPLVFYKRLSDVFDDEFAGHIKEYGDEETAHAVILADHVDALKSGRKSIVRFYIPTQYAWNNLCNHPADGSLGEFVTTAMRGVAQLNPDLQGVLDVTDYNECKSGQRTLDEDRLSYVLKVLTEHRLGLRNTEPDTLGQVYEYLLRKFAETRRSTSEFYTPKEVGWLMAELINPAPKTTVYDPTCGSGGLLIKARSLYEQRHPEQRTQVPMLYGQELNAAAYAMAKINMFFHDYTEAHLALGDTLRTPKFATDEIGLQRFDYVIANPPWSQRSYDENLYEHDKYGRFAYGTPPKSADWAWVQHILASLNKTGRAVIVMGAGAAWRGSGSKTSNKERSIRRALVELDIIEGVVLLPQNLFHNAMAPSILLLLNRQKPEDRKEEFLLVDASPYFVNERPKNRLTDAGVTAVTEVYRAWETRDKLSRVVTLEELRAADYNLNPIGFVHPSPLKEQRIFVSHSHEDADWCRKFVDQLRKAGAEVWYDEHNLGYGKLMPKIEHELQASQVFLVVLSPAAVVSPWVRREGDAAIRLADKDEDRIFLPVMAASCEVPLFWQGYRWVSGENNSGLSPDEAALRVCRILSHTD